MSEIVKTDEKVTRAEAVMITRAINARWPIANDDKRRIKQKLMDALEVSETPRDVAAISKTLVAMEGQNQADDHVADKNGRLNVGLPTEVIAHKLKVEFDQ